MGVCTVLVEVLTEHTKMSISSSHSTAVSRDEDLMIEYSWNKHKTWHNGNVLQTNLARYVGLDAKNSSLITGHRYSDPITSITLKPRN